MKLSSKYICSEKPPLGELEILRMIVAEMNGCEADNYLKLAKIWDLNNDQVINEDLKRILSHKNISKQMLQGDLSGVMMSCLNYGIYIAVKNDICKTYTG